MRHATKLDQETVQQGYPGGVAVVRRFVHPLRAPRTPAMTERFETPPGRQVQVDWATGGHSWHDGAVRSLSAFGLTLGSSRRQYVEFTRRQDAATFRRCRQLRQWGQGRECRHAAPGRCNLPALPPPHLPLLWRYPPEVLYANLKTAVAPRTTDGSIVWKHRFRDFADTHGFTPRACQPYRAQTKGTVERGIRYPRDHFLRGLGLTP